MAQLTQLAFTPDGKYVVAFQSDGSAVWEVAQRQLVRTLGVPRFAGSGWALSLSADGKTLAGCNNSRVVQLWDVITGHELFGEDQEHNSAVAILKFTPDGKTLVSSGEETFIWDAATGKRRAIVRAAKGARILAISPDSKQLAWVGSSLHVWDLVASRENMVFAIPPGSGGINSLFFSRDGSKLFTLDRRVEVNRPVNRPPHVVTHTVRLWDLASGKQDRLRTIAPLDEWGSLAPDGKTVLTNATGHGIKIYDTESGHQRLLPGAGLARDCETIGLAPSWDVKVLASGSLGAPLTLRPGPGIRLWELATGKEIFDLEGHEEPVYAMAWSPNGRLLASGGHEGFWDKNPHSSVRLWDTATGKELAHWGGKEGIGTVAFSPDGTKLAAGLGDKRDDFSIVILDITKYDPALKPAPKISEKELQSRWAELTDDSAGKAHAALWALVASPAGALPFLRERLKAAAAADAAKIRRWIAELDSEQFAVREAATKELKKTDRQVEPLLQEAMKNNTSLETRRRLEQILNSVRDAPSREVLRTIRAIMALERIGTTPARALLESLAQGAAGARETEEAKASLERMRHRIPR
jgi:WD40 repeat protein